MKADSHSTNCASTADAFGAYRAPSEAAIRVIEATMNVMLHVVNFGGTRQIFCVATTQKNDALLIDDTPMMKTTIHSVKREPIRRPFRSTSERLETVVSGKVKQEISHDTYPAFQPEGSCSPSCSSAARQNAKGRAKRCPHSCLATRRNTPNKKVKVKSYEYAH